MTSRNLDQDDPDAVGVIDPHLGQAQGFCYWRSDNRDPSCGQPGVLGVDIPDLDPDHHRVPGAGRVPEYLEQPLAEEKHQPGIVRRAELPVDGQAPSSASHAPSANRPVTARATWSASQGLACTAGPVTVTSRCSSSRPATSRTGPARPMKLVSTGREAVHAADGGFRRGYPRARTVTAGRSRRTPQTHTPPQRRVGRGADDAITVGQPSRQDQGIGHA